jgi:hypothetical protein
LERLPPKLSPTKRGFFADARLNTGFEREPTDELLGIGERFPDRFGGRRHSNFFDDRSLSAFLFRFGGHGCSLYGGSSD